MTCDDLSFIKTTRKTLKPSKKYFIFQNGWEKNFIHGNFSWTLSAEAWDPSCLKERLLEKQQSVPNTCDILPLKKIFWCTFQISLKYIKLVIPKILFILALWNFNLYLKITLLPPLNKITTPPPPNNITPPTKIWPPTPVKANIFLKIFPPSLSQAGGGGLNAMNAWLWSYF